ncbi:Membrane-spanning 4-domains subfamily A member 5 [Pteropus alecto]|uniref:Membrane-spanning 4-domains subfamily A member 5 n=1 Tax=Pteropus alecto TaxID=9402 RepID=L5KP05_PTEAL|nr:Membrane-spanning 4-domains subfamily A member 5 [Pteropus alecto]
MRSWEKERPNSTEDESESSDHTKHHNTSAPDSLGTGEEHGLDRSVNYITLSLQNINTAIMDSNKTHNPVFLVFPPQVTVPEFQSTDSTVTTVESRIPFPKLLSTKMKIFGTKIRIQFDNVTWYFSMGGFAENPLNSTIQILVGLMNFSFGVIFLFTYENPYPRFPFIFVTGYPFWSSALFINSGAFLVALERRTTDVLMKMSRTMNFFSALAATIGIILLVFGFILDQNYFCGYAEEISECKPVTTLFIGILIILMALSIIEFLVSTSFSFLSRAFDCCNCEEWC